MVVLLVSLAILIAATVWTGTKIMQHVKETL